MVELEIGAGKVTARVQGSRARPYSVSIAINPIATAKWRKLAGSASENVAMSAKLLAGEMPPRVVNPERADRLRAWWAAR